MRRLATITLVAATAACWAATAPVAAEEALDLPLRKPGQWQLTTAMDEGKGPRQSVLTMCIEAEMEKKTVLASGAEHRANCSTYEVKKVNGTTIVDASCAYDQRTVTSHTEMSGDFQTAFTVKIESTTSGAARGQPVSVKRTILQEGKYVAQSCGDLQAGEAKDPEGRKVMVQ
jgi:hypothetical protein